VKKTLKTSLLIVLYILIDPIVGLIGMVSGVWLIIFPLSKVFPAILEITGIPVGIITFIFCTSSVYLFNSLTNRFTKVMNRKGNLLLSVIPYFVNYLLVYLARDWWFFN
jgi:hypothetical protein